jgi:hypothetical protein
MINYIYIILLIIFIIVVSIIIYFAKRKFFNKCTDCLENDYNIVKVPKLPINLVKELYETIRNNGTRLDPKFNYNNAKGKKINYFKLSHNIKQFYEHPIFKKIVSKSIGKELNMTDNKERYKIFARLYEDENDFLDWHYDNNFTTGVRYTLVIPVYVDSCNTSEFKIKDRKTSEIKTVKLKVGEGVIYNGSVVSHSISKQTKGCKRMVIVIPFYTNYIKNIFGNILEYSRNIIYDELKI